MVWFWVVASRRPLDLLSSSGRQRRSSTVCQVHCAVAHMCDSSAATRSIVAAPARFAKLQVLKSQAQAEHFNLLQELTLALVCCNLLVVSVSKSDFCGCFFLSYFFSVWFWFWFWRVWFRRFFGRRVHTHTYRDIYGDDEEHTCISVVETPSSAKHGSSCSCKILLFALRRFSWRVECADLVCRFCTNIC